MKLNSMKKEELEVLSYTDLTELILKENKKSMNTAKIFKKICDLLELSDEDYSNKIGDYYTSLTTDKRFVLLDNAEWDLRDKHKLDINIDDLDDLDEEDDDSYEDLEETDESEEELDEDSQDITDDEVDLDDEDELEDLSIVEEEDIGIDGDL